MFRHLVVQPWNAFERATAAGLARLWALLPVADETKLAFKRALLTRLGPVLRHTLVYRQWIEHEEALRRIGAGGLAASAGVQVFQAEALDRRFEPSQFSVPPDDTPVRLIAFYLPQFHRIPENDRWWGEGFTEWTNVRPARPLYSGHYQPHVPAALGYYDLDDIAVMEQQAAMARCFGVGGFCFYFYWFAGTRLLEAPLLAWLERGDIDFPFCLCWANENWSRAWDGLDDQLLMVQEHSEQDDLAFIAYVARYLQDPRYIRVDDRPLLIVYRPALLPDAAATAGRWRKWCRDHGIGEIYLVSTRSFEITDPSVHGFDAALEFPPNNTAPATITGFAPDLEPGFEGSIYDWTSIAARSENYEDPGYPLFRGVNPGWDNTPRRGLRGAVFAGSSPYHYQRWLSNAISDTVRRFESPDQRLVFANAWNEWAEGAHLEPDQAYGYAYLNATRKALDGGQVRAARAERRALIVAHDAHPHGAQYLALHMAEYLARDFGFAVDMVVLGEGSLIADYRRHARLHYLGDCDHGGEEARALAAELRSAGHTAALCNSAATGLFASTLKRAGLRVVALIHELPSVIRNKGLVSHIASIAENADRVVFPAQIVADGFNEFVHIPDQRSLVRPQGSYKRNRYRDPAARRSARHTLRERFGLAASCQLILAVGYADYRKGVDLFVEVGLRIIARRPEAKLMWLGHWDASSEREVRGRIRQLGVGDSFLFPGRDADTDLYFAGADLYFLTSREDPFPSVVMEALDAATPVVAFAGVGGCDALLNRGGGVLAPAFDTDAFAAEALALLDDDQRRQRMGSAGEALVQKECSFRHYLYDVLDWLATPLRRISVVVPNYNYACYLERRIATIESQTYPVFELIVLDDASTDGSPDVIRRRLAESGLDSRLVESERNSGSAFRQWVRGAALARGELVWIAEADDECDSTLMEALLPAFDNERVVMSYAESRQIDDDGNPLADDYRYYTGEISRNKWAADYIETGGAEIRRALAVKNTVPNVSAVLFRGAALLDVLQRHRDDIDDFTYAADWLVYVYLLEQGDIAYCARSLNVHRRHRAGVTLSADGARQYREIERIQQFVAGRHGLDAETRRLVEQHNRRLADSAAGGA